MKYPEFFSILADQCSRFCPSVEAPGDFESSLTELRSATRLGDVDEPLRKVFSALLAPRFSAMLSEANSAVAEALRARLGELNRQKADLEAKFLAEQQAAAARAKAAQDEAQETARKLTELQQKYLELEEAVKRISK